MAGQKLSAAALRAAWDAFASAGGNVTAAAAAIGLPRPTFQHRLNEARRAGIMSADRTPVVEAEAARREIRDAAYWRQRWRAGEDEQERLERALREVCGLMNRRAAPPVWQAPSGGSHRRAAVGLLHVSDVHMGEVIRAEELRGVNSFDIEICRRRLQRLFSSAVEILPRWHADCDMRGVVVALNGDLVSGDIHDELRRTNELTSQQQVWACADALIAGITMLAERYPVQVEVTPGNHGRSTEKPHAKRAAGLSYDIMVGEAIRRHFEGDDRVTVNVSPSRDAVYPILGWTVMQTHGDAIGAGGGKGFAGPLLPVLRGTKLTEWQGSFLGEQYDIILTGHFHTSGDLGKVLSNGSVPGYSEFGQGLRGAVEPPQQWLALVHEKWGVREQCKIRLDDPQKRKARVRVSARSERVA